MEKVVSRYVLCLGAGIMACVFGLLVLSQGTPNTLAWDQLISIETDTSHSIAEKLGSILAIKKKFEDSGLPGDSVYARILHRIGLYEYVLNNEVATPQAIASTLDAVKINSSGKKGSCLRFCINSYTNLAKYYQSLHLYNLSVLYFDSALQLRKKFVVPQITEVSLLLDKAQMLYRSGDYEKAIEELNLAIVKAKESKDSSKLADLMNQRAQSNIMQGRLDDALSDVTQAGTLSKIFSNATESVNSLLIKADVFAKKKNYEKVVELYQKGIKSRIQTNDYTRIADDYTDFGNFFLADVKRYDRAKNCYKQVISYAVKADDNERLAKAHINLEQCSFAEHNYKEAIGYCFAAFKDLKLITGRQDMLSNPGSGQLSTIGNKELMLVMLGNKTELLLAYFKHAGDTAYLNACLQTALLTDSMITDTRHKQTGEQSKLYWRNKTRAFFTDAIEACYAANNAQLAFYFMEKSQAVLLNDKLNEIGASAHLPGKESAIEQALQVNAIAEQLKLASSRGDEKTYELQLAKLAQARTDLEHFIKTLEKDYPAYYQYKYADEVVGLPELQRYLSANKQAFLHYFIGDTAAYTVAVTPTAIKMQKLPNAMFNSRMLDDFLHRCSDQSGLNKQYPAFADLSHQLYKVLFQPLHITQQRVIVCTDNRVIPFEALCTDSSGLDYLVSKYVFSYVYSARFLITPSRPASAKGDFIGFAPVHFTGGQEVASLLSSAAALDKSARFYNSKKLLTNSSASRYNFLHNASGYTIVNIFSHAAADTAGTEPVLYMQDSVVYLSELQLLHNPATKLVVLSACETDVGIHARGEGILSLARGFAAAGIPAVAATLWQADEQTIYELSERFHYHLSAGLPADRALQKAKTDFLAHCEKNRQLPFYWANIILVGDSAILPLSEKMQPVSLFIYIAIVALVVLIVIYYTRKYYKGSNSTAKK